MSHRTGWAIMPVIGPDGKTWGRLTVRHDTAPRSASGSLCVIAWTGERPWLPPGTQVFASVAEMNAAKALDPDEWPPPEEAE